MQTPNATTAQPAADLSPAAAHFLTLLEHAAETTPGIIDAALVLLRPENGPARATLAALDLSTADGRQQAGIILSTAYLCSQRPAA